MPFPVAFIGPGVLALVAVAFSAAHALAQAEPSGLAWDEKVEIASGDGYRGPWRMNESEFEYVDDPTVAIDDQGAVAVAWADQSQKDIFVQIYEPNGRNRFDEPVNVSKSPAIFSWLPRMVITEDDAREIAVLWQEIVFSGGTHGGEIFFARSTDGGRTFSDPINLSSSVAGDGKGRLAARYWHNGSLDLAMGPQGTLYAAWTEYEGVLWFSRSTDGGASFSEPVRVAGRGAKPARGPSLAVEGGGVYLAWTVGEDPAADIRVARSLDQGRSFGKPQIVAPSDGHADAPKLAVDSEGTIHLVYAVSPAGPLERYHVRYTRSDDGGATFRDSKEISGPLPEQFESASFPDLSLDGADNLYVVWELFRSPEDRPQALGFAHSSDGGKRFTSPSIVPGSTPPAPGFSGSQQGLLMSKLAVNETGAVAVVNSTFKPNEASHIWLIRGQRAGS
jgi:hypothetical protein